MKKLITLTFTIAALIFGSISVQAKPVKKLRKFKAKKHLKHVSNNNGHYNRRGVFVYHKTKTKWYFGRKYKLTYKIKVFPNGRKNVKLINIKRVRKNHYGRYGVKTYYRSYTIYQGWKPYRVTYKIKRFPNGYTKKKLVKKVRLRYL